MAVSAIAAEPVTGSRSRLLSLSGVAFVALVGFAFVGLSAGTPGTGDSAATISAYYDAHEVAQIVASLLVAAAAPLLVFFGVGLALALWPADGGRRPFWQVVLAAGSALAGGTWLVAALIHFALTDAANQSGMSGGAVQALTVLDGDSWIAFNSGLGVMMLGAGGALLARRAYPVLGWIALAAGIALFVPYADFPALLVSGLWIVATSALLFRRGWHLAPRMG